MAEPSFEDLQARVAELEKQVEKILTEGGVYFLIPLYPSVNHCLANS
jgi:hypothetical protein